MLWSAGLPLGYNPTIWWIVLAWAGVEQVGEESRVKSRVQWLAVLAVVMSVVFWSSSCCSAGQEWSRAQNQCVGVPTECPSGFWLNGSAQRCEQLAQCSEGRVSSSATMGQCCWPGQSWEAAANQCVGVPTGCPRGLNVIDEGCGFSGYALIPAGTFMQGQPAGEQERDSDEGPQRQVTISRGFLLQTTPVTQGQWRRVMGSNPSYFSSCGDSCPVERVSWFDAVTYLNRLSEQEGLETCYELSGCTGRAGGGCPASEANGLYKGLLCEGDYSCSTVRFKGLSCTGYRLPTEAEWEYAARAGTTGALYGSPNEIAWYSENSGDRTHQVGRKQPNGWGLYDMIGNVWEWTWDWYEAYGSGSVTDPMGPAKGSSRVYRGCSWFGGARICRAAARKTGWPAYLYSYVGFRPARSIP
jgi:formylglycine-generating enzyme required for sulfatase activity